MLSIIGVVLLIIIVGIGTYIYKQKLDSSSSNNSNSEQEDIDDSNGIDSIETGPEYVSQNGVTVLVETPEGGSSITSPVEVKGKVPGSWTHEGQFTIRVLNPDGNLIAEENITVEGDWMTEDLVSFTATLSYEFPSSGQGAIELVKANPSGLVENQDSAFIPVNL